MTIANTERPQVVVSMTSFPQAIPYAVGALRSLLQGSVLPDKLILYLTFAQFADGVIPEDARTLSGVRVALLRSLTE